MFLLDNFFQASPILEVKGGLIMPTTNTLVTASELNKLECFALNQSFVGLINDMKEPANDKRFQCSQ